MTNEYLPGSIVRIKLRNFLTYEATEFYPGPNMNMVIGPNGTGKSTVVCAIALGLAGKPDVLGRTKDLQDFIKHGEEKAMIEIELADSPSNTVIRRTFEKGSNSSKWFKNGSSTNEGEVKKYVAKMNIQVDNLCQFLPQDKVAGFAQMDSARLLRETERAAGMTLLSNHDELISLQKELKGLESNLTQQQDSLKLLQDRNSRLERDVQRLKERDTIKQEILKVETKILIAKYNADAGKYKDAKETYDEFKAQYEREAEHLGPLKEKLAAAKREHEKLPQKERECVEVCQYGAEQLKELSKVIEHQEKQQQEMQDQLNSKRKVYANRQKNIDSKRMEIENDKDKSENLAKKLIEQGIMDPDGTIPEHTPRTEELSKQFDKLGDTATELNREIMSITHQKTEFARKIARLEAQERNKITELKNLDNARQQKMHMLRNEIPDLYRVIQVLNDNRDRFKGRVYDPVMLELSVKDPSFATLIEGTMNFTMLCTFVCELKEDYYTFKDIIMKEHKLRATVYCPDVEFSTIEQRLDKEKARRLGFECLAIEMVDGPAPVLAYICKTGYLDTFPVSRQQISNEDLARAEQELVRFSSANTSYTVRKAYGARSVQARAIKPSKLLSGSVDQDLKMRLEEDLQDIHDQLKEAKEDARTLDDTSKQIERKRDAVLEQRKKVDSERKSISALRKDYQTIMNGIEQKKIMLERILNEPSGKEEIAALEDKIVAFNRKRTGAADKMYKILDNNTKGFHDRILISLELVAAECNVSAISDEMNRASEGLLQLSRDLASSKERVAQLKARARESHQRYSSHKESIKDSEELLGLYDEAIEETVDELEGILVDLQAREGLINEVDPQILAEYNQRVKQIEEALENVEDHQRDVQEAKEKLQEIHDKWKEELDGLVSVVSKSFSLCFSRIGCVGEVRIHEVPEDYSKWGIEILVKFREAEALQILTAHRQSGGERSVSTMLYLIALQSLSKSPFRVVDEINQGMDPRNERLVHKLIVQAACDGQDDTQTSQYFLITPKLLPDLVYHEKMTVLCVFNGVWQPRKWDLDGVVHKPSKKAKTG